jgi:hypothetical protein
MDGGNDPDSYPGGVGVAGGAGWWDKWTPGETGEEVHFVFLSNQVTFGIAYWSFDMATDTWFGPVVLHADITGDGLTTTYEANQDIIVTRNGTLFALTCSAGVMRFFRSTTGGASWTTRSVVGLPSPTTSRESVVKLSIGDFADEDDVCAVVFDGDNNTLEAFHYDNSGDSWSAGVTIDATVSLNFGTASEDAISVVPRHSDNAVLVCWTDEVASATGDRKFATITGEGPQVVTAGGDVTSNVANSYYCELTLDGNTDDIYCAYIGSEADDENDFGTWRTYYKKSTDNGATWGAETQMHETFDDLRSLGCPRYIPQNQAAYYAPWTHNDDFNDLLYPIANSFAIAAVPAPSGSAVLSGSDVVPILDEADAKAGGNVLDITLTDVTWESSIPGDNVITYEVLKGMQSDAPTRPFGWQKLVRGLWLNEVIAAAQSGGCIALWPLDEPDATEPATDVIAGIDGAYFNTPLLGQPSIIERDPATCMDPINVDNAATFGGSSLVWSLYTSDSDGTNVRLNFVHKFSGTTGHWQSDRNISLNESHLITLSYNKDHRDNNPVLWVDRAARVVGGGLTEITAPTGGPAGDGGDDLVVGNLQTGLFLANAFISHVSLWPNELAILDVREIWDGAFDPHGIDYSHFSKLSTTKLRLTIPALPLLNITSDETITVTLPDGATV